MLLTVYNANALKLIVKDVAFGDVGGTTGGKAGVDGSTEAGKSISIDNNDVIKEMLFGSGDGAGYKVDYRSKDFAGIDEFRTVVGLQKVISANYGEGTWGMLSDKMQWSATEADGETPSTSATLNYEQGGLYSNIRNFNYTSYVPTTDFLIVGKGETENNAEVTITAKHAATGKYVQVKVDVHTLRDKLYLFRFNPKTTTQVAYTNGKGVKRYLSSDEKGELAVYEPSGIQGNVMAMSEPAEGEIYVGTIYQYELSSGERDVTILDYYPCHNKTLKSISSVTLTFITPDGKPYDGEVILRGGVYKNDTYCPTALIKTSVDPDSGKNGREDVSVTAEAGKVKLWFDPTQFKHTNEDDILDADDTVSYAFEYRFAAEQNYQPGYVIINPASNDPADSIVNLHTVSGSRTSPQIVRQDYQQYLNGSKATDYKRNVIDSTENIGISTNFSKAVLYTVIALPGENVTVGEQVGGNRGYSIYENSDAIKFAFYPTGNETKLTGQTDISSDSVTAAQITNLSQLNDETTYFVFPFSSMPMLRSTYVMTNDNLTSDGISDVTVEGKATAPTARIKAVFTRGNMTVASINMPFGVSNLSHQPDLNSNQGATTVGKEVRSNLKESTDIGAIFRSINVNDMIRKGFVFLGNLAGAGGDNPINLMILPTQDPATFRIIAFVGANQRGGDDDDGVSVNFNSQDLAEDMSKFKKEMEELNKKKDDDEDSGGEGSMEFNFYGTIILEARVGIADGKWNIAFRGGNVGTNVKGKYEWGQTFFCGPYPAFVSFEVGFHADLEVAFGNKSAVRAMLLDAALGVSVEAFAGLGFDLSIVALQLGIYGQIGADVNFLLLTPSDAKASTGTKLTISGEIGIKLKVKLLFISYTEKFASTGFNWTKKWNNYDQIKQYWNNQGFGTLMGTTRSGRAYTMYLFDDGSTIVEIEGGAELENRDYLELAERSWTGGAASGRRLMRSAGAVTNAITDVETNSYPYSHPAFTDDGALFLYVSDNDNAKDVQSVVSYAVKSGAGYANSARVDTSEGNVLADLDVVASGTKDNAFAAWVKQVETPKRADKNAAVTNDELSMMFNATEIYAGAYNGTAWTTTRLTDNYVADMAPTVASSANKAIVAWRSMNASTMATDGADVEDITAMFDVENNVNYRIWNGSSWTEAKVAYNGASGTVNAIDSAMLYDGTAILVYTVRTGEDVSTTETFYTVIGTDGNAVTTGRLTSDSYTDTNAQVTAVNEGGGGYFVLGWYSEHDAGEGTTAAEYDANGNVTATKAVVAHDIRLARINANGSYDIDFPESIGGSGETGVSSDFHFSAPVGNMKLENVSVVWSQRMDSDEADDAGKYELNAVRFFKADDVIGTTAPTNIATTDKNYTVDRFDAYTDSTGAIHAIILGTDYSTIEGIEKYDSIDLDKVTKELGENESNSDSPNNLDILDGEAISSLKLATGTFPETAADVTADINISEVIPGYTTPVQFTVTNTGTSKLASVTVTVGGQNKEFTGLNLLPNQSATLIMSYNVPEGAVSDANYTVTSGGETLGSGTLALNRPDVGISGIKLLQEYDGKRDIQVMLGNSSAIPLAGSGKTVKLAFYKDPFHESMIGKAVSITNDALAEIDAGTYTTVRTLNVTDIAALVNGEIPEEGLTVYARAWVDETEEPNSYNNDNYLSFTGLLARNNGEKLTTDTSVEENEGGYTVYADIRNNSMKETNVGIPVALLLDESGEVIAQKNFRSESLSLTKEKSEELSVAFTASDIEEDKTPARAAVCTVCTVTFDLNGGTSNSTIDPVQTDLAGHITLPETKPTKAVAAGAEPLFFAGWYTAQTGGDLITANYTFTKDTTVYAHYVNHQHAFTYTKESEDSKTIIATCANTDQFCYLDECKATLTIAAPDSNTYTGEAIAAKITDANGIKGSAKVLYATKGEGESYGDAVETVPVNVGAYRASITLGTGEDAKTVSVDYNIENAELTNVSASQNGALTYTGSAQTPQVTTAATSVNNQTVTFTYSTTEGGEYGTMPTFTNVADSGTVYFKASAPNHEDATGSFTVTMNKATPTAPAAPRAENISATSITLDAVEGCEYSTDGNIWQDSTLFTGLTKETLYTFYQRLKATDDYNASSPSTASFKTTAHDHNWGSFSASGATISAICGNSDGSHDGATTDTMVINAPALTIYGGEGSANATVTNGLGGISVPTIVYKQGDTVLKAAPTAAGTYTASITLTGVKVDGETTGNVTASVTYTIAKAGHDAPTGVKASRTDSTITVTAPAQTEPTKYEYSKDNGASWQNSAEFTGLTPSTTYQVVVREKETENYHAGTPSAALAVATLPIFTMTGTARYGRELTATNLTAANGSYSYQWYRVDKSGESESETAISGATGNTYTISSAEDIGKTVRVRVTVAGTDAVNTGVIDVDSAVVEVGLYTTPVLSVSKTTVTENTIKIDGFENYRADGRYQYSIDGGTTWTSFPSQFEFPLVISGLTGNTTYSIVVQGVEVESGAPTVIKAGAPSVPLTLKTPAKTVPLTGVRINGTAQVGSTLTAAVTGKDGEVPTGVTYQWYRGEVSDGNKISGATGAAYTLIGEDYNKTINVKAEGAESSNATASITKDVNGYVTVAAVLAVTPNARKFSTTATQTTITVPGFGNTSTRHYEYACVEGNVTETPATGWQSGNEFSRLTADTKYTVFVRTGGEAWQVTGTAISKTVQTLEKPLPYSGAAPTVAMSGYTYGGSASAPVVNGTLVDVASSTYEYRKVGAEAWTQGNPDNTLAVGTYEIRATIAKTGYSDYTTATTNFTVSPAPLTTPTVTAEGVTITVSGNDPASKKVQYVVVDMGAAAPTASSTAWKSATLDSENKFTLTGLKESHNYKVYVRSVPAATETNYTVSAWSAEATGTTPTTKTVVYDLNGGKVKSRSTFALTATFTEDTYTLANGSAIERPGYTFDGWKLNNSGDMVTSAIYGGTYVAQWTANTYSVTFDPNGGTGTMNPQTNFTYGTGEKLTNNNFTYEGHVFAGWATTKTGAVRYGDGQTVTSLTTGESVTLYAVWGSATNVTGTITGAEGGVTEVTLKRGDIRIGETQIAALAYNGDNQKYSGSYTFKSVPDGIYNIVAVQNVERLDQDGNVFTEPLTVTSAISIVNGAIVTGNASFAMPESDYSSIVSVAGTDTPPVVVGGLDTEAASSKLDDRSVTVTMTVEKKDATTADVETKNAIEAIASTANAATEERDYLNIDVKKEITKNGQSEGEEAVTETAKLIDISIPYDLSGKSNAQISLYRFHDGEATKLGTSSNDTSYYTLDRTNNLIVLHTKLFSTYAIGYNPDVTDPGSGSNGNNGGSVGGAGGTQAANETANGTFSVAPQNAKSGETVTITVKPNEGYEADTVTVTDANGKAVSVTRVNDTTYTFTQPSGKVKIDVTFKPDVDLSKFVDVDVSAWYAEAIRWAVKNNVMNGVGDNLFNPNGDTSRAMIVTMLWRLEGSPAYVGASEFSDVDSEQWYGQAVRWANAEGIVMGDNGKFAPNDPVTREQLATILYRYAQYKKLDVSANAGLNGFGDAMTVSEWALPAMEWACDDGVINGIDGNLVPKGKATRAQVATMLMRFIKTS